MLAGVHSSSGEHAMPSFHCRRRRFRMELSRIAGEKRFLHGLGRSDCSFME